MSIEQGPTKSTPVAPPSEKRQPGSLSEEQDFTEVIEVGDLKSFLEGLKGCPHILSLVEETLTPEQKEQYSDTLRGLWQDMEEDEMRNRRNKT